MGLGNQRHHVVKPGGIEMQDEEWNTTFVRTLGVMLSGDTIDVLDFYCRSIQDDTFLMLLNAHRERELTTSNGKPPLRTGCQKGR